MKNKPYALIYKHTHKKYGMSYVGQTVNFNNPERRFKKGSTSYRSYKGSTTFHKALLRDGWEAFETTLLCTCFSKEETNKQEEYFIKYYNCLAPKGYNSVLQTETSVVFTDLVRKKISDKQKQYYASLPEPRIAYNRNKHIENDGKILKCCSLCEKNKELKDFGNYKSTWDKLTRECKECRNKLRKTKYPYQRKSEQEVKKSYEERASKFKERLSEEGLINIKKSHQKKIYSVCIGTKETKEYESLTEACEKLNVSLTQLSLAIKFNKVCKGFRWYFK